MTILAGTSVKIISQGELTELHTGSLLTRRKKLLQCEESFALSDRAGHEEEYNPKETGYIEFKNTIEWKDAYNDLKEILANREHREKK